MTDIIRAFAEQIFVSGFIHCDPHPGNIFVRPDPKNPKKHQVVILDFGLCI
jgi:aarF domain-containing kinase